MGYFVHVICTCITAYGVLHYVGEGRVIQQGMVRNRRLYRETHKFCVAAVLSR